MSRPIRAVYEGGRLRLLDPIELAEGAEVQVEILHLPTSSSATPSRPIAEPTEGERFRAALGDSVRFPTPRAADDDFDDEAAIRSLREELRAADTPSVSEYIIQERREGP